MKILFAASEGVPFVKTGGLADVIGSLPKALRENGVDARVILPKYSAIPEEFQQAMTVKKRMEINLGWRKQFLGIEVIIHDGITYYFIDNQFYFFRDQVYGYGDSFDEAERFTYFIKAILEALPYLDFQPDIIHSHDWQTALLPYLLKTKYQSSLFYKNIKTVFTIHNLKYQGVFPYEIIGDLLEIPAEHFTSDGLEFYSRVNYMKAGLLYSDYITTVSQTYANEIQHSFFGYGLEGVLHQRKHQLAGILNGIDYDAFNPQTDPNLFVQYKNDQSKRQNKVMLQYKLGLPEKPDTPIIAMITRLVQQKGLDLILHVIDELLSKDVQLVILGTGEKKLEDLLKEYANKYSNKMSVTLHFDEGLSRKIYAASDMLLMPSLFEPCGLSQLIALRYEAVPIVRETGGLKDSVMPFNEHTGEGIGFTFANYNAHDMLYTINRAIHFYHDKIVWNKIINNAKKQDFSWKQSAERYIELYQLLLESREDLLHVLR